MDNLTHQHAESCRKELGIPELMELSYQLLVVNRNKGVRALVHKGLNFPSKIDDILINPLEPFNY